MGLDNGIMIKNKDDVLPIHTPFWIKLNLTKPEHTYDYGEICYWRKCWNIRDAIIQYFGDRAELNDSCISLSQNDVKKILKILKFFNKKSNWDYGQYWEYDEIKNHLRIQYKNLRWVYWLRRVRPGIDLYFYDSY